MATWLYLVPDRKLRKAETEWPRGGAKCPACGHLMLRMAFREANYPYHWMPSGHACTLCSVLVVEDDK